MGCPNVRAAASKAEVAALTNKYEAAHKNAHSRGVEKEFLSLTDVASTSSHVIVAMPPLVARNLVEDPRNLYAGYETLVGAPTRTPAPFPLDSERRAVSGKLFGSYAKDISYGVLSMNENGLLNYGSVFVCLHDLAIRDRVSFLHENSYHFLQSYAPSPQAALPLGFRSDWSGKGQLVATKLEPNLVKGSTPLEWAEQLLVSGHNRADDQFIEAHIFGPFNVASVDTVRTVGIGDSRREKIDIACIKESFQERCHIGGTK